MFTPARGPNALITPQNMKLGVNSYADHACGARSAPETTPRTQPSHWLVPRILPRPPAHHQIAHSGSAKGAVDDFITSACPETRPFGLARSFKPSPSRRSTAHSATDDQDHKLRDRFASLSASSPARRALLEKSSLAAWRALNLDLALRRACSSGERRCKPWSRRPNLGVLHVSVRWSNCHFKGRSGPPFLRVVEKPKV